MIVTAVKGELLGPDQYRPTEEIRLTDDAPKHYLLEAYCLDFERDNPSEYAQFTIGEVDESALSLIRFVEKDSPAIPIVQAAVWLAAGISGDEIRKRFEIDASDLLLAEIAVFLWKNP